MLPSVKSKAYNDNYRSIQFANKLMASNMTSNKSIQFLDVSKSVDFSTEKEDSISLTGGTGSANNVNNVVTLRSPDYLLNDGSLVNLESIDKSAVHDS
jgi:hypothetical protein